MIRYNTDMKKSQLKIQDTSVGKYHLSITTSFGSSINTDTDNLEKSIAEFQPQFIKGSVILKVNCGDKKYEKLIFAPAARRLFYNGFSRKILARNIERVLL